MPSNLSRTHIRVRRSDGREFPTLAFAFRQLLGTSEELTTSEAQRLRLRMRHGRTARDSHGFAWESRGDVPTFRRGYTQIERAVSDAYPAPRDEFAASIVWTDLTFGVEIECMASMSQFESSDLLSRNGFADWRVVRDGSLNIGGREVISPILRGEEGLDSLKSIMDLLRDNGHTVDDKCGLHVHIGARDLSTAQLRNVAHRFLSAEPHFDSIVPPSRRMNRYCQSNLARMNSSDWSALRSARNVGGLARAMNGGLSPQHYNQFRYYKLNFQSYSLHGTVEFREHSGTIESQKACAWVRLIAGFVADSASHTMEADRAVMSWETFIGFAAESDRAFLTSRRDYFAQRSGALRAA